MNSKSNNFLSAMKDTLMLGRKKKEPVRDTLLYPMLMGGVKSVTNRKQLKPSSVNLRYFSRTPYVRSAIDSIKNPILENGWEIKTKTGIKLNSELQRQIDIATNCFAHPNQDDSLVSLLGLVVEDYLVMGAGCIEHQLSNDLNRPLWMWSTDSQSIYVFPGWSGKNSEARYMQVTGNNTVGMTLDSGILLRNDELTYIKCNSANDSPYGFSPVQIAFNSISRQLGAGQYAGNKASNAQPENLIWLGATDPTTLERIRAWWRNSVEGQGETPFFGSQTAPTAIKMHGGNDDALYLKWQEFLIREIAAAFSLTPMNLGIERDVNRSTAEVSEERDYAKVIRPLANNIAEHLTREILHSKLGWYNLEFKFSGLDREDQMVTSEIYEKRYKNNLITPNEERERLGLPPLDNYFADKVFAEAEIEIASARGAALIVDPDLQKDANLDRKNQSKFEKNDKEK